MSKQSIVAASVAGLCLLFASGCARSAGSVSPAAADSEALVASPFATCSFFYREGATGPEQKATLTVARGDEGEERTAATTLGDFRLRVTEGSEHPHVAGTVTVWVGNKSAADSEWLGHTLYQLGPQNPSLAQEMGGGHGFTGLHYVKHPQSGNELQWLCTRAVVEK